MSTATRDPGRPAVPLTGGGTLLGAGRLHRRRGCLIRVAIRFDDPSPVSQRCLEESIIDLLGRAGVPVTFAVVPFSETGGGTSSLNEVNAAHLLAAQRLRIVDIALHG